MAKINIYDAENRAKAVRHVVDTLQNEPEEWEGDLAHHVCFNGWCGIMSPVNRKAFVSDFGEEATADIEREAREAVAKAEKWLDESNYMRHLNAAKARQDCPALDVKTGDFLIVKDIGIKFDHENFKYLMQEFIEATDVKTPLVRVDRVVEVPADFFDSPETCFRGWKPEPNEGGMESDDVQDGKEWEKMSDDERKTFFMKGVLVRDTAGRFVFIDPEGCDYARYCMLPVNFDATFPELYGRVKDEIEDRKAKEKAEADAKEAASRAAYDARCAKWERKLTPVTAELLPGQRRQIKANILTMAKIAAPGICFSLARYDGWGHAYDLTWTNGPTVEELREAADFALFETGRDTFDGMTDCADFKAAKYTDFAKRFGAAHGEIRLNRKVADTDRNRKPKGKAAVETVDKITVKENKERNGVEIYFPGKPDFAVREDLKKHGFRWSKFQKAWYNRATPENIAYARSLAA